MPKFIKEADVSKLDPPLPIGKAELRRARRQGKIRYTPGQRTHWYLYDDLLDLIKQKTEDPKCVESGNTENSGLTTTSTEAQNSIVIGTKTKVVELDERERRAARALRHRILKKQKTDL